MDRAELFNLYKKSSLFFPLIGSVIEGTQEGEIFFSDSVFLVVHKFNFGQLIFQGNHNYSNSEEDCVLLIKQHMESNGKLRIYNVPENIVSKFENYFNPDITMVSGPRLRYSFEKSNLIPTTINSISIDELKDISDNFDLNLFDRFWTTPSEVFEKSFFSVSRLRDINVSVCYAAAVSNLMAEVDVATLVEYRRKGYAKGAIMQFVYKCILKNIVPMWDCYENNIGSVKSAEAMGFVKESRYNFLIITKNDNE